MAIKYSAKLSMAIIYRRDYGYSVKAIAKEFGLPRSSVIEILIKKGFYAKRYEPPKSTFKNH